MDGVFFVKKKLNKGFVKLQGTWIHFCYSSTIAGMSDMKEKTGVRKDNFGLRFFQPDELIS